MRVLVNDAVIFDYVANTSNQARSWHFTFPVCIFSSAKILIFLAFWKFLSMSNGTTLMLSRMALSTTYSAKTLTIAILEDEEFCELLVYLKYTLNAKYLFGHI